MGFGFRKSFKVAPGVRLNVGTKSAGVSFGGKGLRYSVNTKGRRTTTVGIPGSGLSYSTSSGPSRRTYKNNSTARRNELMRLQKEMQKQEELKQAQYEVEVYENQIEMIKSIHKECDDFFDWEEIKQTQPPFQKGAKGPKETQAFANLESYQPGFFDKLFKQEEKKKEKLHLHVEDAKKEDETDYLEWESMVTTAEKIVNGDIDTYLQVIDELSPLDDLSEFGSGFEFFVEEPTFIEIEFDVHSENTVPTQVKSLTKTGKLSIKDMTKTNYYDLYQDYVCSCILRIARDMFAILPLDHVYVHAMDEQLNTSTGHTNRVPIVSVKIDRATLNTLNFETIDCSDSMQNFDHHMIFKKTTGFQPVEFIK
jgi:hypothetical protein